MANIRSAEKQRRQAEKRKERNRAGKSKLKSALKKARATVATGTDAVKDLLSTTSPRLTRLRRRASSRATPPTVTSRGWRKPPSARPRQSSRCGGQARLPVLHQ